MHYDAHTPIAVFLGPSLDTEQARSILRANYYPPVKWGDIDRLMATNLRIIVIIDGLFDAATPIWQREILMALREGITVVGASSMGALRAVELAPYGMVGVGTIYQWYAQGEIEGDDEVTLLHLGEEHGYHAVSEPLVNIRHKLALACRSGLLEPSQSQRLLGDLKNRYYADRTYDALFAAPIFRQLPIAVQDNLKDFLQTSAESLKQRDAIEALTLVARIGEAIRSRAAPSIEIPPERHTERPLNLLHRSALTSAGELIALGELLGKAVQRGGINVEKILERRRRRFYLLRWMEETGLKIPDEIRHRFIVQWRRQYVTGDPDHWLMANGITKREFDSELSRRAAETWLLRQDPSDFGLPRPRETADHRLRHDTDRLPPRSGVGNNSMANCYINDWAQCNGIRSPYEIDAQSAQECVAKTAEWVAAQSPSFFGFDLWSADSELLQTSQVTGAVLEWANLEAHREE